MTAEPIEGAVVGAVELVDEDTIEFKGLRFRMAESVGLMPLMRFAKVAKAGVDSNELEGLTAMYDLLQQCIHDDDWLRFEQHATDTRADGDELMTVTRDVMAKMAERPTKRPSDTSDGPRTTSPNSTDGSTSRVVRRLESEGRPDLALLVTQTAEARAS
jgi:hypothetical protein